MTTNIELKAYCKNKEQMKEILLAIGAKNKGSDQQTDSYFHSKSGVLMFREGNAEKYLIHYNRDDKKGAKESQVNIYPTTFSSSLKEILETTIGTTSIIVKTRDTYVLDNMVFHVDTVDGLGDFIEIKAMNFDNTIPDAKFYEQCNQYIKTLEINAKDLVSESYVDLLRRNNLFSQILVEE